MRTILKSTGYINIGIIFLYIWNSQWCLYNTQSILIGRSPLSQEYSKLIGLYLKLMRRQLCPITANYLKDIKIFLQLSSCLTSVFCCCLLSVLFVGNSDMDVSFISEWGLGFISTSLVLLCIIVELVLLSATLPSPADDLK